MKDRVLVSIIVNNYNYDKFLSQAIDSALNQSYHLIEVIVVDDGSTDSSREIISSYKKRVVPVLKENEGQASAFNAGFKISKGDIVIFLDSDDFLFSNAVERLVAVSRLDWVLALYQLRVINPDGEFSEIHPPSELFPKGDLKSLILSGGEYVSPPTSGMAYKRQVLEKVLPIPEKDWAGADSYLRITCPFWGKVLPLHEVLGAYRIHSDNKYAQMSLIEKCRRRIKMDIKKDELIVRLGTQLDFKAPMDLFTRQVNHLKARISSLKLDPDRHPFHQDKLWILVKKGAASVLKAKNFNYNKRVLFLLWFVLVLFLPKSMAKILIEWLFVEWTFQKRKPITLNKSLSTGLNL